MPAQRLKRTIKNETLSPFALSTENPWLRLAYRYDEAEPWNNALASPLFVLPSNREDLRTDVLHAFDIAVDVDAIRRDGIDPAAVELLVLARDGFAKKILNLLQLPLGGDASAILSVPRDKLEATSLSARIDFHVMLVTTAAVATGQKTIRRGGKLASHTVSVSTEKKGNSFNFSKTTPQEFVSKGLPAATTFHLNVEPLDLIEPAEDVSQVLSVMVHEDAWSTLQEIRTGDRVGEALGVMFLSDIIFAVLTIAREAVRSESRTVDDASVTSRLLGWIGEKSGHSTDELTQFLMDDEEHMLKLKAMIQETLRLTHSVQRVRLGEEEQV